MSEFAFLIRRIRELQNEVERTNNALANLNARHERMFRYGKVKDVDPEKHRYRQIIDVDGDDKDVLSDWIPYSQIAGTRKHHTPPSEGQQMLMISVDGDHTISFGVPLTWHEKNPSPSQKGDEDVDLRGKSRWTQRDASIVRQVDGLSVSHTKQSHSLTVHKDPENKEEGKDEEVSDEKPWKGNRAKKKHTRTINKDAGYALAINDGDDEKEHKVTMHPDNAYEVSTHKGKHSLTIKSSGIKAKTEGSYEREAQSHIKDKASQIQHEGPTDVQGTLNVSQLATFGQNLQVGGLGSFMGGLSTGALEVATDEDGGLVEAEFAFIAGGGSFTVDALADGGRCAAAHGLDVSTGGASDHGIGAGAFRAVGPNEVLAGPTTGADAVPSFRAIVGADLPSPQDSALGGVKSASAALNQFMTGVNTSGEPTFAQPAFSNLSGGASVTQLPALNTLGNYADDSAAASGGVAVGALYRTGSTIKTRIA